LTTLNNYARPEWAAPRKETWYEHLLPQRATDAINQSPLVGALSKYLNSPTPDLTLPSQRDSQVPVPRAPSWFDDKPIAADALDKAGFLANFFAPSVRLPGRPQIARAPEGSGGGYDRSVAPRIDPEQWDSLTAAIPKNGRRVGDYDLIANPRFDRVTYDLVPAGKPVWDGENLHNGLGQFQVKPGQNGGVEVTNARVADHLQRQGLGSSVYDMIARDFPQTKLVPSPWNQLSDNAVAFWAKRDRDALLKTRELAQTGYEPNLYPNREIPTYAPKPQGVIPDDKLIEILRKYGLLPPVAAGAASLAQQQEPPL